MKHTLKVVFRRKDDHSGGAEAIVSQGSGEAASYRITKWHDDTFSVSVQYHGGEPCGGLHTEYVGDIYERLNGAQLRDLLMSRLGESALEIPAYLRMGSAFAE